MRGEGSAVSGVFEFIHGYPVGERQSALDFWKLFGFEPIAEGRVDASAAESLYGHGSDCYAVRLAHPGCAEFGTGYLRLEFWENLRSEGLGGAKPLAVGSRWMGIYTRSILRIFEAFQSESQNQDDWWLSPLVRAAFAWPEPEISFASPFLGLREFVSLSPGFRLAFVERVGFERPGFGTFADSIPFKNTEGTHANIVQPVGSFSTEFYKNVFGLVTMANGEAHDSGEETPTIAALNLDAGQTFRIERLVHPECPAGMLQVYSPYQSDHDARSASLPGVRGLGAYSYRVKDIDQFCHTLSAHGATGMSEVTKNAFGEPSVSFTAPDGIFWTVCEAL